MASSAGAGDGGRAPEMNTNPRKLRMSIEEVAKKLTLWHSATFRPILTHDELEPILSAAGFAPVPAAASGDQPEDRAAPPPAVAWREYVFLGGNAAAPRWLLPRPRLPFPRVDGLHLKTYEAFLGAVEACLGAHRVACLFHVRLMPVTTPDRVFDKQFRPMRNVSPEEDGLIVYREGTLDDRTMETCSHHTAMTDAGHHVIPGISCRNLGYLRRLDGNCHDKGCGVNCPAAGYNSYFPLVVLQDICPDFIGR